MRELQTKSETGLYVNLDMPYEEAIERVTAALKSEGFGILTQIDVKDTLKKKLDVDFRRYVILGACNPPLAYRALRADLDVGLLLPCNVVVYEGEGGKAVVGIANPLAMLSILSPSAELESVAQEARAKLERVVQMLSEG